MDSSDIFEKIKSHPGVTVRTHISSEHQPNKANNAQRHRYETLTPEIIKRMRELDNKNVKRLDIAERLNISPTSIYYYCGPKKNRQTWQLRKKRK